MIKAKTIQQYQQILRSHIQNFNWETCTQSEGMAWAEKIKQELSDYYVNFRVRSKKHDSQKHESGKEGRP